MNTCKHVGLYADAYTKELRNNGPSIPIAIDNGCGVVVNTDGYMLGHGSPGTKECTELVGGLP